MGQAKLSHHGKRLSSDNRAPSPFTLRSGSKHFSVPADVPTASGQGGRHFFPWRKIFPIRYFQFRPPAAPNLKSTTRGGREALVADSVDRNRLPTTSSSLLRVTSALRLPGSHVLVFLLFGRNSAKLWQSKISTERGEHLCHTNNFGRLGVWNTFSARRRIADPCDPGQAAARRRSDLFSLPGDARGG